MRILLLRPDPGNERFGLGPLGARRFFELYAEPWRRTVLNTSGDKTWLDWARQVRPSQIPYITRVLWRTQRLMQPHAYLREHEATRPMARA